MTAAPGGAPTSPTLYDVLGLTRDASREEVRAAWRDAVERFEPGPGGSGRQFRLFNEAAEVLLDPERRAAYDTTLEPDEPQPDTDGAPDGAADAAPDGAPDAAEHRPTRWPPGWPLLAGLALLTAALVGAAAFLVTQARAHEAMLEDAPAAAESAAVAVLGYDHRTLEADREAAQRFMTEDFRATYLRESEGVPELVGDQQVTVEAQVVSTSSVAGAATKAPDRLSVLMLVEQRAVRGAGPNKGTGTDLNRVRFDMVEVDGRWLVDHIQNFGTVRQAATGR